MRRRASGGMGRTEGASAGGGARYSPAATAAAAAAAATAAASSGRTQHARPLACGSRLLAAPLPVDLGSVRRGGPVLRLGGPDDLALTLERSHQSGLRPRPLLFDQGPVGGGGAGGGGLAEPQALQLDADLELADLVVVVLAVLGAVGAGRLVLTYRAQRTKAINHDIRTACETPQSPAWSERGRQIAERKKRREVKNRGGDTKQ
ncbi:hypothetical protein EYF80_063563 [Liparis tanakae]|uniref:Uncharacterized protein n=1 Tax=Liparis tanakae TaxID=230148 RepID=A0A4Z2ECK8_9TELE|nr:hypothetical protein EYF80_063563 [Liparis tanakae]